MTCDLVSDIATLTGWAPSTIYDLPYHCALYYALKTQLNQRQLCEWLL